jgi:multiple sugar transport system substrate-binding protein
MRLGIAALSAIMLLAGIQLSAAAKPKLTMWVDMNFFSKDSEALYKSQAMDYARQMGFDLEFVQDTADVMKPRESAAIESKTLPDVLYCAVENTATIRRAGQALEVSDVVTELNKNMGGFTKGMMAAVTGDGKQWAVPYSATTEVFYSRLDVLATKGLKAPDTWEQVFSMAKTVNNPPSVWGLGMQVGSNYDTEDQMGALLWAYGSSVFGKDGKTIMLDTPGTRQVLTMIRKAWDDGLIPKDSLTWDTAGNNQAYQSGKVAFILNTGSVAKWMNQNDKDLLAKTALTAPPAGPNGRFVQAAGYNLVIPVYSKNIDLAKGLIKYLSSPAQYQAMIEIMQGFHIPAYAGLTTMKMWQDPMLKPLAEAIPFAYLPGFPGPVTDAALQAYQDKVLASMCVRVLADNWTPDKAIAEAVQKVQKIADRYK